ncbi:DUF11 domain-containing protein [Fortiea sp. LEGE XX443]|uniref:DUF11 domain-containing protein n=1 Tax=Fortiea sp. LEGE XX443 TaxID=1828611 RepID=UPI0018800EAE|nr:DUF11 domain-containing protein [Fortiea sp. LEGE XX443]MBE9004188.1 DUF11 domain-containing protein [Fortiea sp. LEGE XX443]
MNSKIKNILPNSNPRQLITSLAFCLCVLGQGIQPSFAEGSRSLYPSGATGNRANLEWRTDLWGGLILRRTILKVYAEKDEYILLGSSAVRVNNGDIRVFQPGRVTGSVGSETIPATPDFQCSTQTGRGVISSRTQELAGPQSISGSGNTTGYIPCYYQAPSTGIYDIVFYGPVGDNTSNNAPTGQISLSNANNFNANQGSTVAAWDVTIRSSDQNSTTDLNGRLFSYYLALFTGANGRPLYFPIYPVTTDGYRYRVDLRGTDPDGFLIYGNQVGFYDSDGITPLYHNILAQESVLTTRDGSTSLSRPQFATFFNPPNTDAFSYIDRYRANGTFDGTGIPLIPSPPTVSNLNFTGTVGGSTTSLGTGGTFTFNSNITGNYEIVISRDGVNFDPTNSQNRVLRGVMNTAGGQSVTWNGKDNSRNNFPVGTNYPVRVKVHAGEYHFPLLDAENNFFGGPTITLLNASNPLGNTTAFYDDRGYTTIGGTNVGTPGQVLCGTNPPNPAFSNPISGFNSTSNDRKFGVSGNSGNAGVRCTGSFGDTKGLDLWTYFPSNIEQTPLNIVANTRLLLVKRITRINNQDLTDIVDGRSDVPIGDPNYVPSPRDLDDDDSKWPTGYLRGQINAGAVKPGDELEYTIYFLSNGGSSATNVRFCDLVPPNTTFMPTAFNGLSPNDGGSAGADQGIALAVGSTTPTVYFSNAADGDRGSFYPANDPATPTNCGSNSNGSVVVNITKDSVLPNLSGATGRGTPANSYGFVRFRAKVK